MRIGFKPTSTISVCSLSVSSLCLAFLEVVHVLFVTAQLYQNICGDSLGVYITISGQYQTGRYDYEA